MVFDSSGNSGYQELCGWSSFAKKGSVTMLNCFFIASGVKVAKVHFRGFHGRKGTAMHEVIITVPYKITSK